jgi:hypothetical protein
MSRRPPEIRLREAALALAVGLAALTVFSAVFYRAGGPRWPHVVVDGCAWFLVVTTGILMALALAEKVLQLVRHRHWG